MGCLGIEKKMVQNLVFPNVFHIFVAWMRRKEGFESAKEGFESANMSNTLTNY